MSERREENPFYFLEHNFPVRAGRMKCVSELKQVDWSNLYSYFLFPVFLILNSRTFVITLFRVKHTTGRRRNVIDKAILIATTHNKLFPDRLLVQLHFLLMERNLNCCVYIFIQTVSIVNRYLETNRPIRWSLLVELPALSQSFCNSHCKITNIGTNYDDHADASFWHFSQFTVVPQRMCSQQ